MREFHKIYLANAAQKISNASDKELFEDTFKETVFKFAKANMPALDKNRLKADVKTELITINNAPVGMPISVSGEYLECAIYNVPISGDMSLFKYIVKNNNLNNNILVCKVISKDKIVGNANVLANVNAQAKDYFDSIERMLNNFEDDLNIFYEKELIPKIKSLIEDEKMKRETIKKAEELYSETKKGLNPFI